MMSPSDHLTVSSGCCSAPLLYAACRKLLNFPAGFRRLRMFCTSRTLFIRVTTQHETRGTHPGGAGHLSIYLSISLDRCSPPNTPPLTQPSSPAYTFSLPHPASLFSPPPLPPPPVPPSLSHFFHFAWPHSRNPPPLDATCAPSPSSLHTLPCVYAA